MLRIRTLALLVTLIAVVLLTVPSSMASPAATSPTLGSANSFVVLAATTVTNIPTSAISGDVGLTAAGSSYGAGLTMADMVTGTIYSFSAGGPAGEVVNPALLTSAMTANTAAFGALSAVPNAACDITYSPDQDLVGLTLVPGVYCFPTTAKLTTGVPLILDGGGNPAATWIFRIASGLNTTPGIGATVIVTNSGSACNVWWQVGSSATIGSGTKFIGNILALTSISLGTGASLQGRALAQTGAVTMDQNTITRPICALAVPGITTQIHDNVTNVDVTNTTVPTGTIVHDMAMVTGTIGIPAPTGIVSFTVYANQTCSVPGTFAGAVLLVAGVADPSYTATLTIAGLSYLAHYNGDGNYNPADGPCEVLGAIPTAVELLYFQVGPLSGQQVQLKWATALEVDNFGFNLYRANVNDMLRASLIHFEPAVTQGSGSGATYLYVDTAPYAGPWWYWLSDVDTQGRETFHDTPINITVQSNSSLPYHVYFPSIAKGN